MVVVFAGGVSTVRRGMGDSSTVQKLRWVCVWVHGLVGLDMTKRCVINRTMVGMY